VRWPLTILGVMVIVGTLTFPALAGTIEPPFLDRFTEPSYDGDDGTLRYNGPWIEVGESNGPSSGYVRATNHEYCDGAFCLKIGGSDDAAGHGAYRAVDLTAATSAKLTFDYGQELLTEGSGGSAVVQVSPDGGDTWRILKTISFGSDDGGLRYHKTLQISDFATPDTIIRFMIIEADGLDSYWLIDNIAVEATFSSPPTTTSTTGALTTTTTKPPITTSTTTTMPPATTSTTVAEPPVTATSSTTEPPRTTTTTRPRDADDRTPEFPEETTTTTGVAATSRPPTTSPTPPQLTTSDDVEPEADSAMPSRTAVAVPSGSMTAAMPISIGGENPQLGHNVEPVQAIAAVFFTETGNYGGSLIPSIALGILIAIVSLIGIGSRTED
jgi:hypothetical protein